jgi:hypothetical protein
MAADYFCFEYNCRFTMMTAHEDKPKRGACLGGLWELIRLAARALGPFCLRLWLFIDSVKSW